MRLILLAASIAACAPDASRTATYTPPIRRDSGGVAIVENTMPLWRDSAPRQIDAPPLVVIGSDSQDVALHRLLDIRLLHGGRIVAGDAGLNQVMVFDSTGALESRFLRRGEGPGEMNAIVHLEVCGGDSIVVADYVKAAVFDSRGTFGRQVNYRMNGQRRSLVGVSADCGRLLAIQTVRTPPAGSMGVAEDGFSWIEPDAHVTDSVMTAAVLDVWTRQLYGVQRPFVVPWGTSRTYALDSDFITVGYGRVPEIRRYDSDGNLVSMIRWSDEPRPLTGAERNRYENVRLAWLADMPDDPESEFLFPPLDEYPDLPASIPIFDLILVDANGSIWVRRLADSSFGIFDARLRDREAPPQTWTVFDSKGTWLGDIELPERFDLKAVSGSRLYGISKDENDVETLRVLRTSTIRR